MRKKTVLNTIICGAVCAAALLLLYAVKGIFPFGGATVATQDMAHGYLPVYYHLWDFLHGKGALDFTFLSGTGVNMIGVVAANGLLSPVNLLLYLFPRGQLLGCMSFMLLARIFLTGCSAAYYFEKRFPSLDAPLKLFLACSYALSGFTFFYYYHLMWLDCAAVFPLVCLYAERLIKGEKDLKKAFIPTVLWLTLTMICSYYIGCMVLLFLLLAGAVYMLSYTGKSDRPGAVIRLGLTAAATLLLPMILLFPAYRQAASSMRFDMGAFSYSDIFFAKYEYNTDKAALLSGMQAPLFCVLSLIAAGVARVFKKNGERLGADARFALGSSFIMLSPALIEGADLLWHFGSYKSFPLRFSFMSVFLVCATAGRYFEVKADKTAPAGTEKTDKASILGVLPVCISAVLFGVFGWFAFKHLGTPLLGAKAKTNVLLFAGLTLCGLLLAAAAKVAPKTLARVLVFAMTAAQILATAYLCVGETSPLRFERPEHDVSYIAGCGEAAPLLEGADGLDRVRNTDMSLNVNYGLVTGAPSISNWTHQIPTRLQNTMKALGYSTTYTLLLDAGGTAFSDALLGIKTLVSSSVPHASDAVHTATAVHYSVYDCKYTLPPALLCGNEIEDVDLSVSFKRDGSRAVFDNLEKIYSALGGEGELFKVLDVSPTDVSHSALIYNSIAMPEGEHTLYFSGNTLANASVMISANMKPVYVPEYLNEFNRLYKTEYDNGVLDLGNYDGGEVDLTVDLLAEGVDPESISFAAMDCRALSELCEEYNSGKRGEVSLTAQGKKSLEFSVNNTADGGRTLFIPVNFDEGWSCRIDGEKAETKLVCGTFIGVSVPQGEHTVKLSFTPSGTGTGAALSAVGALLFAGALWFLKKDRTAKLPPFAVRFVTALFFLIFAAFVVFGYLLPFFGGLVSALRGA